MKYIISSSMFMPDGYTPGNYKTILYPLSREAECENKYLSHEICTDKNLFLISIYNGDSFTLDYKALHSPYTLEVRIKPLERFINRKFK